MVGVALQGEGGRCVPGECLQVAGRLAELCERGEARMPEIVEADGGGPPAPVEGLK